MGGCYWQTVPSQWGGGRLFGASAESPHKNGHNSGTKSRRLDPLVSKFAYRPGLPRFQCKKTGFHMKKLIFGPKSEFLGPKKNSLLSSNHVLAPTGQNCAKEKVPFSQI